MAEKEFLSSDAYFVSGADAASLNGKRAAIDFWKWSYSDLMQNTTRGYVAQFIVAWALGVDNKPNDPWRSYDVKAPNDKTIEVKSTAYLQAWKPPKRVNPLFVLEPTRSWSETEGMALEPTWNAEIYVLAFFYCQDPKDAKIMNLDQWKFWVFSKEELVNLLDDRKTLTVAFLEKKAVQSWTSYQLHDAIMNLEKRPRIEIAKEKKAELNGKMTESIFFEKAAGALDKEQLNGLWQIYHFCSSKGEIVWGTKTFGAIFPRILDGSLFNVNTNGEIQLNYGLLKEPQKSTFIQEISNIKEMKAMTQTQKGHPMCKNPSWLLSRDLFIHAIEKSMSF